MEETQQWLAAAKWPRFSRVFEERGCFFFDFPEVRPAPALPTRELDPRWSGAEGHKVPALHLPRHLAQENGRASLL